MFRLVARVLQLRSSYFMQICVSSLSNHQSLFSSAQLTLSTREWQISIQFLAFRVRGLDENGGSHWWEPITTGDLQGDIIVVDLNFSELKHIVFIKLSIICFNTTLDKSTVLILILSGPCEYGSSARITVGYPWQVVRNASWFEMKGSQENSMKLDLSLFRCEMGPATSTWQSTYFFGTSASVPP